MDEEIIYPWVTEILVSDLQLLIDSKDNERLITIDYLDQEIDIDCDKSILEEYKSNLKEDDFFVELFFDINSKKLLSSSSGFYANYRLHKEFIFDLPFKNKDLYIVSLDRSFLEQNLKLFEEYIIFSKNFKTILEKHIVKELLNLSDEEELIKIAINNDYLFIYDNKESKFLKYIDIKKENLKNV